MCAILLLCSKSHPRLLWGKPLQRVNDVEVECKTMIKSQPPNLLKAFISETPAVFPESDLGHPWLRADDLDLRRSLVFGLRRMG